MKQVRASGLQSDPDHIIAWYKEYVFIPKLMRSRFSVFVNTQDTSQWPAVVVAIDQHISLNMHSFLLPTLSLCAGSGKGVERRRLQARLSPGGVRLSSPADPGRLCGTGAALWGGVVESCSQVKGTRGGDIPRGILSTYFLEKDQPFRSFHTRTGWKHWAAPLWMASAGCCRCSWYTMQGMNVDDIQAETDWPRISFMSGN